MAGSDATIVPAIEPPGKTALSGSQTILATEQMVLVIFKDAARDSESLMTYEYARIV